MVSQLLVASRLEAGVLTPQQEVFAVPPLVERTWARSGRIGPSSSSVDGPPHLAVADPDRLEQVLWAVLDNAVKYSPPGSAVEAVIEARDGEDGDHDPRPRRGHGRGDADARPSSSSIARTRRDAWRPTAAGSASTQRTGPHAGDGRPIEIASRVGEGTAVTLHVPAEPSDEGAE